MWLRLVLEEVAFFKNKYIRVENLIPCSEYNMTLANQDAERKHFGESKISYLSHSAFVRSGIREGNSLCHQILGHHFGWQGVLCTAAYAHRFAHALHFVPLFPVYLKMPWIGNVSLRFENQIRKAINKCLAAANPRLVLSTRKVLSSIQKKSIPATVQKSLVICEFPSRCGVPTNIR